MEPARPLRHIRLVSPLSGAQLVEFQIEVTARIGAVRLEAAKLMRLEPYQLRLVDGDRNILSLMQPVPQEDELSCEMGVLIIAKENGYHECQYCEVCRMWLRGPTQMANHRIGKKHKKNERGARKKAN